MGVADQRDLAEEVAGAEPGDGAAVADHVDEPADDDEELVGDGALAGEDAAGGHDDAIGAPRHLGTTGAGNVSEHGQFGNLAGGHRYSFTLVSVTGDVASG